MNCRTRKSGVNDLENRYQQKIVDLETRNWYGRTT